jgi:hypothetical protein
MIHLGVVGVVEHASNVQRLLAVCALAHLFTVEHPLLECGSLGFVAKLLFKVGSCFVVAVAEFFLCLFDLVSLIQGA